MAGFMVGRIGNGITLIGVIVAFAVAALIVVSSPLRTSPNN
jgi:hypothetical protein